jgi:hypothetical protein
MTKSESEQTFAVGNECVVVIEATSGDVHVSGWDRAEVRVNSGDEQASVRQEGATFQIRPIPIGSGDVSVQVPHQCDLTLRLVSGDCTLEGTIGQVFIQTMSGDVKARNLQGDVNVRTVSGDISLLGSHLAHVEIGTVSGDSTIESPLDAGGAYHVHSVSGDVRLLIPENQPCTVKHHSLSGEFKCKLPFESRRQGWGKLEAVINGGGVAYTVDTTSGDVTVAAAGALPEEAQPRAEHATKPLGEPPSEDAEPFAVTEPVAAQGEDAPSTTQRRMEVLKAIEEGKLSVTEGLAKLRELE